jgi:uncharacterized protein
MMKVILTLLIVYVCICVLLYFLQERLIFFPEKTPRDRVYRFSDNFEELYFTTPDQLSLHGVLFKARQSKGLIFYLHGNAGSIESWGDAATVYTSLGYDVFMLDYRGYGKSEGSVTSEQQLHDDVNLVFNQLTSRYAENRIVILGYSIGTGPAVKLAAERRAKLLILQAPFYSFESVMKQHYAIIPTFILRYKFETYKYLPRCRMPVVIFHGEDDNLIDLRNATRLKNLFKATDTLITLKGVGHNGMTHDLQYLKQLKTILGDEFTNK